MPVESVCLCVQKSTGKVVGSIDTELLKDPDGHCMKTSDRTGIPVEDLEAVTVTGNDAERAIGNVGVGPGMVIDLATMTYIAGVLTVVIIPELIA